MAKVRNVFLSSVAKGFEDYRRSVYQAIQGLKDCKCIGMEDFGAQDSVSVEVCKVAVAECDIFVGLFGPHYGSYVPGTSKSFTEVEYDTAVAQGKSRFLCVTTDDFQVNAELIESDDKRAKQKDLRQRALVDRQIARFRDAEQVGRQVLQAIYNHSILLETSEEQQADKILYDSQDIRQSTTLLFSFVTNQAGFDTGLVVVNASAAPFGSRPQAGLLTIHYFGFCQGGRPAPPLQTSPVIPPGQHAVWTLSSGGTVQIQGGTISAAPGFQGYVVVECEFPDAHGVAYIAPLSPNPSSGAVYQAKVLSATASVPKPG